MCVFLTFSLMGGVSCDTTKTSLEIMCGFRVSKVLHNVRTIPWKQCTLLHLNIVSLYFTRK